MGAQILAGGQIPTIPNHENVYAYNYEYVKNILYDISQ